MTDAAAATNGHAKESEGEKLLHLRMSRIKSAMKASGGPSMRMTADALVAMTAFAQYVALRWLYRCRAICRQEDKKQVTPDLLAQAKERDSALSLLFPYVHNEMIGQGVRPIFTNAIKARNEENKQKREERDERRAKAEKEAAERVAAEKKKAAKAAAAKAAKAAASKAKGKRAAEEPAAAEEEQPAEKPGKKQKSKKN